jgi:hypothetical protein
MVGLPRLELGTCGIRELSRMLAFVNSRSETEIKVKMVALPRLELGTCGARELSRMLAFANRQVLN